MKRLVFAKRAVTDLEAIADYIATDCPMRATTFVRELRGACAELRTMPERYPLVQGHQSSSIRRRVYGSYDIFPRWFERSRGFAYSTWGDGPRTNSVSRILSI